MKKVTEDVQAEEVPALSTTSEKAINTQLLDSLDQNQLDTLLMELLMRKQATQKQTQESESSPIIQEGEQEKEEEEEEEQEQSKPVPSIPGDNTSLLIHDDFLAFSSSDDSDDYICLYYNYNGMNSHLFRPNERVENVLKYFFAIRSGFDDEDTSDYCLVTKANLTRTLPIYKTIEEVGLEDGMQVESILLKTYSEL